MTGAQDGRSRLMVGEAEICQPFDSYSKNDFEVAGRTRRWLRSLVETSWPRSRAMSKEYLLGNKAQKIRVRQLARWKAVNCQIGRHKWRIRGRLREKHDEKRKTACKHSYGRHSPFCQTLNSESQVCRKLGHVHTHCVALFLFRFNLSWNQPATSTISQQMPLLPPPIPGLTAPSLSRPVGIGCCVGFTVSFVGSLYLFRATRVNGQTVDDNGHTLTRDHPAVIRARLAGTTLSSLISVLGVLKLVRDTYFTENVRPDAFFAI